MNHLQLLDLFSRLKAEGKIDPSSERRILEEIASAGQHEMPPPESNAPSPGEQRRLDIYRTSDYSRLMGNDLRGMTPDPSAALYTLDDLLKRDEQREQDGFPKKIRVGRLMRPSKTGNKIVVLPTTVEEKLIHDNMYEQQEEETTGGTGDEGEGEVIGEAPMHPEEGEGDATGPGDGDGGDHEIESTAKEIGRIVSEKLQLPNLKEKRKKFPSKRYTYDLTDIYRGAGQFLDEERTVEAILHTNIALGRIKPGQPIDPTKLLVSQDDEVYRVLSRERTYESRAIVFLMRDYSGSMWGWPTETVVQQHVMIYSWLKYQYEDKALARFLVHDTQAKEVPDIYTYYNIIVAGGTKISSGYQKVRELIEEENLHKDYNIYLFHGTDGDDWDKDGKETIEEIDTLLDYCNRIGITVAKRGDYLTTFESYMNDSGYLEAYDDLLRLDAITQDESDDDRIIEGIRRLVSEDPTPD